MDFENYLQEQNLAESTINKHIKNLYQYGKVGESQRIMIKNIENQSTLPVRLSYAGTLSKYLQFKKQPNSEIVEYIRAINKSILSEMHIKHKEIGNDPNTPTTKQLIARMNTLYDEQNWRGFCVMYLMITYQVRNMDMMAKVVKSKKQTNNIDNWFIVGRSQVTWVRNKYKTFKEYGTKIHVIKNERFMNAIRNLDHLLSPSDNVDRVIKKITNGLTEGLIAKIVLKSNNTINGLKRVSANRGTNLVDLIQYYNIT